MTIRDNVIITTIFIPTDKFPWKLVKDDDGVERKLYDVTAEPLATVVSMNTVWGFNDSTDSVMISFLEGCDLDKVMLFKLTWGGL